jgi:hypothetical protein
MLTSFLVGSFDFGNVSKAHVAFLRGMGVPWGQVIE